MLLNLFFKSKWKQLKLQVWKNRLLEQWKSLEPIICPWVNCSLHVSWGHFYNGTVLIDRRFKQAKIIVQIPYDGYLTAEDQKILSQFSISKNDLPYFILFHEISHLFEIMPFIKASDYNLLKGYLTEHRQMASSTMSYKELPFEEQADHFAYQMLMKNCRRAS